MPRTPRVAPGGLVYHVLNRSAGRFKMFRKDSDYAAFERVLTEAHEKYPLRILSYCVLATHWHFVAWPREDGELTQFFRWLANTHAVRWRVAHDTVGWGHLYQGRFKSFPIKTDEHLLTVCRYVERNAVSAELVDDARRWRWGSMWAREHGDEKLSDLLCDWPVVRPADWPRLVNTPLTVKELERLQLSIDRGRPFGDDRWTAQTAARLGMESTLRSRGGQRKSSKS
ncbi:MAG TPA: transposase [Humisphaera sp.]|nr:transposase [Humisphaera sp.]